MQEGILTDIPGWLKHTPLVTWMVVYFLTCVVGALLILLNYRTFILLFEYFSGVKLDLPVDKGTLSVLYALLLGAPLLVWVGYLIGLRLGVSSGKLSGRTDTFKSPHSWPWAVVTFGACLAVGVWSLIRGGAFEELMAWVQFDRWIQARWRLFSQLSFFEFVNLYLFLPLAAGWLLVDAECGGRWRRILARLSVVVMLAVEVLLFQKKSVIVSLLLLMGIIVLWRIRSGRTLKRPKLVVGAGSFVLAVIYFSLVVLPVYRVSEEQISQAVVKRQVSQAAAVRQEWLLELMNEFGGFESHREAVFFYALLAPLTRTSVPAIYYSFIFPREHPFYGLDIGQDILGFGSMPDDNKVVWKRMNPDIEGGSVAAPFHFVLYSQVGLLGAMLGSFLVGLALGWGWFSVLGSIQSPAIGAMAGSLIILLAIYLAIDSVRNSLIVSYGVVWGWLFLFWVWLAGRIEIVRSGPRVEKKSDQFRTNET
ncbi:MAG: hypothetical protein D6723_20120 [Acidobacteria bacterium]|nr:MAG: hypothetical protein D6723_20120 [Acidobacteriota bacterium]